jgi:hypothetical protein
VNEAKKNLNMNSAIKHSRTNYVDTTRRAVPFSNLTPKRTKSVVSAYDKALDRLQSMERFKPKKPVY